MFTFGAGNGIAAKFGEKVRSSRSDVSTDTATGVSCSGSSRLRAVLTTSSRMP